eukprot:TRINITY_DN2312_c0_g1_i2.p1 TRINITY_DN2312_c0_g1~~TRINITY_DN2312_c0_g1_i2.p1  ORF type:complete len:179 (-),score=24.03 TRINITY_DN2312_c0_g1_i2:695-1231(-)
MTDETPICRICYDAGSLGNSLFQPCRCKGTAGFVHRSCLERWRHMNRDTDRELACDICQYRYRIVGGCRNSVIYKTISHVWSYSSFASRNLSSTMSLTTIVNALVLVKFIGKRLITRQWPSIQEVIFRSSSQITSSRVGCYFIIFHLNQLMRVSSQSLEERKSTQVGKKVKKKGKTPN